MSTEPSETGPLEQGPANPSNGAPAGRGEASAPATDPGAEQEADATPPPAHASTAQADGSGTEQAPASPSSSTDPSSPVATPSSVEQEASGAEEPAPQPGLGSAVLGALGSLASGALSAAGQALTAPRRTGEETPQVPDETPEAPAPDAPETRAETLDPSADVPVTEPSGDVAEPGAEVTPEPVTDPATTTGDPAPAEQMTAAPEPTETPDAQPQPEAPADTQPEPPADTQPEPPADAQPEPPADAQPEAPEVAAEVTPEPEAEPATEPATEPPADGSGIGSGTGSGTDSPSPAAPSTDAPSTPSPPVPSPAAVPRPKVRPPRVAAPAASAVVTPPLAVGAAAFGRVDETGGVHVRDGDTEREVGQYPDVPEAEALAFYVRKFEDLAGQVHLLGQRLDNSTVPAKEARSALAGLREQATDAKAVGDLPALRAELDRLDGLVAERTAAEDAQRAEARAKALAEREAIVAEAEQIASTPPASMHFKNAGERMQELLDTWKNAQRSGTRLDKRTEDPLWKRFAAARSTVDRLRRAHFSQVSEQRSGTKAEKEAIIARAEELQTSTDWRATSDEYRALMDRWKAAGRLARKDDDALWARFRAAQDVFFASRTSANSAQDEEYRGNLTVKEGLAAEAEALLPVTDVAAAKRALSSIQDRWDEAGRVPRDSLDRIEARLRAVIEKVRDADSARWGKSTPDVVQRGSGLVTQLRQQVADLDAKIADAEARGDARTAQRAAKERDTKRTWLAQAESSLDDLSR